MSAFSPIISLTARLSAQSHQFLLAHLKAAGFPDIAPCHGDVFAVLFHEDGLGLMELARRSGRSKSTVSVMVRRLTSLGYLEKTTDLRDPRAVCIRLSQKGRQLRPVFDAISEVMQQTLATHFTPEELKTFEALLRKGSRNFENLSA